MPRKADEGGPVYTVNPKGEIVVAPPPTAGTVTTSGGTVLQTGTGGYSAGVLNPNDPAVIAKLKELNPSGTATLSYGVDQSGQPVAGTPTMPAQSTPTDYSGLLGLYGLPADVQAKVNEIYAANMPDLQRATAIAMGYVRGTDWYAKTYPGIAAGITNGLFGDEAGYRNYLNSVNQLTRQYQGRDVGSDELSGYIAQGYNPGHVGQLFQGQAWVGANKADVQYTTGAFDTGQLSSAELAALGNENAGLDSELGQRLQNRLNLAQQRLRGVFSGSLATPGLSTANGRLQATSLGGKTTPDVGA